MTFLELNLIPEILNALKEEGYEEPSPIQAEAIPSLLEGRDLLGCAQTGTGKTAAFSLPILQKLTENKESGRRKIRALILTPTRELAAQIEESLTAYGRYLNIPHAVIFGGVSQKPQEMALRAGVEILVATPGRLKDLHQQGLVNLSAVEFFVLDEADRMLDMGFIHDVRKVIELLPEQRQNLLFSATMPPEIVRLTERILHNPVRVEVTPQSTTVEKIKQSVYLVDKENKRKLLIHLLKNPAVDRALVFSRTKHGADRIARELVKNKIETRAIHGDKSQTARTEALKGFKNHEIRVLVATDIAARGIDVDDLAYVFNFDLPNIPETYVHRIGRTGRAGKEGIAISFCDFEEQEYLEDILRLTGAEIEVNRDHPFPLQNSTAASVARAKEERMARSRMQRKEKEEKLGMIQENKNRQKGRPSQKRNAEATEKTGNKSYPPRKKSALEHRKNAEQNFSKGKKKTNRNQSSIASNGTAGGYKIRWGE